MSSEAPDRLPFRDWPGWARRTAYVVTVIVLILVIGVAGSVVVARRALPQTDGVLHLKGLHGKVDVLRDAHGIPQVYADTSDDLFFAQGFVQAQDRFYEMDFRRHVTAGRLSELLGPATVEADMYLRTLGWRRVAERELDLLDASTQRYLQAFSDGVNAYLARHSGSDLSLEYAVLGLTGPDYRPEKWTPVDSLAWLKAMAWDLRGNMDDEIARAQLSVDHTPEQIAELYPPYPYDRNKPIITSGDGDGPATSPRPAYDAGEEHALAALQRGTQAIPELLGHGSGLGSNSWVVGGQHTVSGKPLLANDPHLDSSLPGVWYQMGLHCRSVGPGCPFDVSGFTFAGLPGVVIGHNQDIAWGFTNLGPDVTDLYLEKVDGGSYLYNGREYPLAERQEVILVRGGTSRTITVRATRHGPLLSDVSKELSSVGANAKVPDGSPSRDQGYAVALQWTALTPGRTADAIFGVDRANDWTSFRNASRDFAVPSQNLVYADTDGNIGYQAPGDIPIRKGGRSGDYPVPGWTGRNDWTGRYVPFDQLPSELNPPEGFIVTANQAVTDSSYPWFLGDSFDHGYRSQRIRTLLEDKTSADSDLDVDDMTRIQDDTHNPMAPVLLPYLMRQLLTSQYYSDGQRLLVDWDGDQPASSAAAAYFNVVWSNLLRLTFHDQLPESLWPSGDQRWMAVVARLLRQPNSQWWDDTRTDGVIEDRDQILTEALRAARDELTRLQAESPDRWRWGFLHHLELRNQSLGKSGVGLVEALFNRGPYEASGGNATVDAANWNAADGYAVTSASSMRMVVDLSDLDRSRWINLTGASGHVLSENYHDQTGLWLAGRTLPWAYDEKAVRRATEHTLTLEP